MESLPHIIVVAGPTASGKSDFAVNFALKHNGEIISADSRQIYKGLDIGTGKITQEEMRGVTHHMIDVVDIGEDFSVAAYRDLALPILEDILKRGRTPIICGGTGQYIDALIFSSDFPKVPPNNRLRKELEKKSVEELYKKLEKLDPKRAKEIDRHNKVRLIRALEILESFDSVPELTEPKLRYPTKFFMLSSDRKLLRERIKNRLQGRLGNGMTEEVKGLLEKGVPHEIFERLGLEYRYVSRYLSGKLPYEKMAAELLSKIAQYAKRQETWNKKYTKKLVGSIELIKIK